MNIKKVQICQCENVSIMKISTSTSSSLLSSLTLPARTSSNFMSCLLTTTWSMSMLLLQDVYMLILPNNYYIDTPERYYSEEITKPSMM